MIKVEFFGLYRLNLGVAECEVCASNILELLAEIERRYQKYTAKELRNSIIIVNNVNILQLKKYKTKLYHGDTVLIMSPASGG